MHTPCCSWCGRWRALSSATVTRHHEASLQNCDTQVVEHGLSCTRQPHAVETEHEQKSIGRMEARELLGSPMPSLLLLPRCDLRLRPELLGRLRAKTGDSFSSCERMLSHGR